MNQTPPPLNQRIFLVDRVGSVPLSAGGLNSTNWPHTWGNQPPTNDPLMPVTIGQFAEHMGYHLTPLFTAVNTALGAANAAFAGGQHPPGWVALTQAMDDLNKFLDSSDPEQRKIHLAQRLALPFVGSFANGNTISTPIGFTASYTPVYLYAGTLQIHVDVESTGPDPLAFGSWQIVTGYEIEIWDVEPPKGVEKRLHGGSSSSSSYYASSSSSPVGGRK